MLWVRYAAYSEWLIVESLNSIRVHYKEETGLEGHEFHYWIDPLMHKQEVEWE